MAPEEWAKVPDVAKELGIPRSRAYDLIARGQLPAVRVGERSIRVPRKELTRWLLRERPASRANTTEHD